MRAHIAKLTSRAGIELAAQKTLQVTGSKQAAEQVVGQLRGSSGQRQKAKHATLIETCLFQDVLFSEMLRRNLALLTGAFMALLECTPLRPSDTRCKVNGRWDAACAHHVDEA